MSRSLLPLLRVVRASVGAEQACAKAQLRVDVDAPRFEPVYLKTSKKFGAKRSTVFLGSARRQGRHGASAGRPLAGGGT